MPWWSEILFLAFVCLNLNNGVTSSGSEGKETPGQDFFNNDKNPFFGSSIDIQFDNEPMELLSAGGSGHGAFPSDDEDIILSGSGSGSGFGDLDEEIDDMTQGRPTPTSSTTLSSTTTRSTTPVRPLSDCELDSRRAKMLKKKSPECLDNGDYAPMQCMDLPGMADCWCVDMMNNEIHGTRMEAPNIPSCDDGENLSPCVHELVKAYRPALLGSFKPRCAVDGQYEKTQCMGSICYCVDASSGTKVLGTEVSKPGRPDCKETEEKEDGSDPDDTMDISESEDSEEEEAVTLRPPYQKPQPDKTGGEGDPQIVFPDSEGPDGENVNIDGEKEDKEDKKRPKDPNKTGVEDQGEIGKQGDEDEKSSVEKAGEIMTQPGILAGIIGGGVVLLLCLVLLVMFIIYRMRKKDEGSYPLDEPRRPANYSYVRTPDKEFYA